MRRRRKMKAAAASGSAALGGCAAVTRSGFRGVTAACVWRKKMGVRVCARVLRWRVMGAATNLEEGDGERCGAVREEGWSEGRRIGWRMMGAEMGGDGSGEMMVRSGRGR